MGSRSQKLMSSENKEGRLKKERTRRRTKDAKEKRSPEHQKPSAVTSV